MTESGSSPEPQKSGWRITLMQGVIGAVSLAGTTAIPLLVTRYLSPPPTPTSSPTTEATPALVSPAQVNPVADPVQAIADPVTPVPTTSAPITPIPTTPAAIAPVATPPVPVLPAQSEPVPPPPPEIGTSPPTDQLQSVDSQPEQLLPVQTDENSQKGKKNKKDQDD